MSLNITEVTEEQEALEGYEEVISKKSVLVNHYIRGDDFETDRTAISCEQVFSKTLGLVQYRFPEIVVLSGPSDTEFYAEEDIKANLMAAHSFLDGLTSEVMEAYGPALAGSPNATWVDLPTLRIKPVGKIGERVYYAHYVTADIKEKSIRSSKLVKLTTVGKIYENIIFTALNAEVITAEDFETYAKLSGKEEIDLIVFVPMKYLLEKVEGRDIKTMQ